MQEYLYATIVDGAIKKVHRIHAEAPLTQAELDAEGLVPFERIPEGPHNPLTEKIDGDETIITPNGVTMRPKVVPLTPKDIRDKALKDRKGAMPENTVSIETLARILDAVVDWIDLQVVPGQPKTRFNDARPVDRELLKTIITAAAGKPMPNQ
jgi:hypothetical protein